MLILPSGPISSRSRQSRLNSRSCSLSFNLYSCENSSPPEQWRAQNWVFLVTLWKLWPGNAPVRHHRWLFPRAAWQMCRKITLENRLSAGLFSEVLNACGVTLCDDVLSVVGQDFSKFLCQITNPVAGWKLKTSHLYKKASSELMPPSLGCDAAFWGAALPVGKGTALPGLTTPPQPLQSPFNPHSSCFNLWLPFPLPTPSSLLFFSAALQPLPSWPGAEGEEDFILHWCPTNWGLEAMK